MTDAHNWLFVTAEHVAGAGLVQANSESPEGLARGIMSAYDEMEAEAASAVERFQVERKAHHETSVALSQILQALAGRVPGEYADLRGWATSKANSTTPKIQAEARATLRALDILECGDANLIAKASPDEH